MYGKMIRNNLRKVKNMSEKNLKRLHLIYGIVLGAVLCVTGAMAIAMCVDIYNIGPSPFTRQSVGEHFAKIAPLVYILIALVIGGGILSVALPPVHKKLKGDVDPRITLYKLSQRLEYSDKEADAKIEKQRILRLAMVIVSAILVVGASVLSIVYTVKNYDASSTDINKEVIKTAFAVLRYFLPVLAYVIVTAYVCKHSVKKELDIVKAQLALQSKKSKSESVSKESEIAPEGYEGTFTRLTRDLDAAARNQRKPSKIKSLVSFIITGALIVTAIVFIILGVSNGGMADVVTKAINICTECIGMG